MFTYFKMKINEWKVKAMFYGLIVEIADNQTTIVEFLKKMYLSLKDVSVDDFKESFIKQLAEIVHEQNQKIKKKQ